MASVQVSNSQSDVSKSSGKSTDNAESVELQVGSGAAARSAGSLRAFSPELCDLCQ